MFNTIITTVKTLLRRPSTWVWGALFPIALSTMFMFMFANLSSDGTVDPVPGCHRGGRGLGRLDL